MRTQTRPKSCDPEWDETFVFNDVSVDKVCRIYQVLLLFDKVHLNLRIQNLPFSVFRHLFRFMT